MNLRDYQKAALRTKQSPASPNTEKIVPLLGLSGEVGELLNAYKKHLRDGDAHLRFGDQISEELGDILWYLSDVATQFDLDLEEIALRNLEKVNARWGYSDGDKLCLPPPRIFDADFPDGQQIPRQFRAEFQQYNLDGGKRVRVFVEGRQLGQELTDNAHEADGYRFHDVFHLACAAILGWSPITRRNLNIKRKADPKVDEVEDGGRAGVIEEGISALVFAYASDHASLVSVQSVDYNILKVIKIMTQTLEVSLCTTGEWEHAILEGYQVWRQVEENEGGIIELDLDARSIRYSKQSSHHE